MVPSSRTLELMCFAFFSHLPTSSRHNDPHDTTRRLRSPGNCAVGKIISQSWEPTSTSRSFTSASNRTSSDSCSASAAGSTDSSTSATAHRGLRAPTRPVVSVTRCVFPHFPVISLPQAATSRTIDPHAKQYDERTSKLAYVFDNARRTTGIDPTSIPFPISSPNSTPRRFDRGPLSVSRLLRGPPFEPRAVAPMQT